MPNDNARVIAVTSKLLGKGLEINKELVLSTAHMPKELASALEAGDPELDFGWDRVDQGYLIFTGSGSYPMEIQPAIDLALAMDCKWLRFDADGPIVVDLQVWEW